MKMKYYLIVTVYLPWTLIHHSHAFRMLLKRLKFSHLNDTRKVTETPSEIFPVIFYFDLVFSSHTPTHTYIHTYICAYILVCACLHTYICTYRYTCMPTCIYTNPYVHIYTHIYIHYHSLTHSLTNSYAYVRTDADVFVQRPRVDCEGER